jgi:glutamyl-tRNA reductase
MTLFVFGINHTTAPVAVREQVTLAPQQTAQALRGLIAETAIAEAVILSTCNRMEVYGFIPDDAIGNPDPALITIQWLTKFHQLSTVTLLQQHSYCYQQDHAVRHAIRVGSGLDSMVLGEAQILGQLKLAYAQGQQHMAVSSQLTRLFQHTFNAVKEIRNTTNIGANPVSVAFSAVRMARQIFTDLSQQKALLIGAGKTIELVGRHLHTAGLKQIIVANRTLNRAQELAFKIDATCVLLAQIPDQLPKVDIVISCTASQLPILGKGLVERALRQRRHQPMLMVDIAVPRDIEAEVNDLEDVYLYTVDDLKDIVDDNIKARQQAASAAELIVNSQVNAFLSSLQALNAVDLIKAYRSKMERLRDTEVTNSMHRLNQGEDAAKLLQMLGRNLTNKIIHLPTVQLRKSCVAGELENLRLIQKIFELEDLIP